MPPRHGKTETILAGIVRALLIDPTITILYATHTATFAAKQSKRAKKLAREAGVEIEFGSNRADEWETTSGGGLVARGVGGEIAGRGFKIIVVDDPVKNRQQAESPTYRDHTWDWLTDDVFSRGHPNGAIIVNHTRWHVDDTIGRIIEKPELEFSGSCLRAIAEPGDSDGRSVGEALAPEIGWTAEALRKRKAKVGEYGWSSLYQGRPRKRGGSIFSAPSFYTELPARYTVAHGVDLAYSEKQQADYSVCVTMAFDGKRFYVLDVIRKQVQAPEFLMVLVAQAAKYPGVMLFRGSGTEKGTSSFFKRRVRGFVQVAAVADKFINATEYAAAWNHGQETGEPGLILLPDPMSFENDERINTEWVGDFLTEHDRFTGVKDPNDDQVDAAGNAHHALAFGVGQYRRDIRNLPQM